MKKIKEQKVVDQYGECPKCGESWVGGEIFDSMRDNKHFKHLSDFELYELIKKVYPPPYQWSKLINIEYQGEYDGVWEYQCPYCKATFPSENQIKSTS